MQIKNTTWLSLIHEKSPVLLPGIAYYLGDIRTHFTLFLSCLEQQGREAQKRQVSLEWHNVSENLPPSRSKVQPEYKASDPSLWLTKPPWFACLAAFPLGLVASRLHQSTRKLSPSINRNQSSKCLIESLRSTYSRS